MGKYLHKSDSSTVIFFHSELLGLKHVDIVFEELYELSAQSNHT